MTRPLLAYPWLTEGAIAYLGAHLTLDSRVLEFGAGGSTIWLAHRARKVYSIEHNADWAQRVRDALQAAEMLDRATVIQRARPYDAICAVFALESFDVVLVDGRDRVWCATAAKPLVKPGGLMVLDNAERRRYREIETLLADWPRREWPQLQPRNIDNFTYPNWTTATWTRPLAST